MKTAYNIYHFTRRLLAGRKFIWAIIILFIIQSLWIAFSFRFPMLYDEAFHFDAITLYASQLSLAITEQPVKYDIYGSLSNGGATMFHYLLSFPYRIIDLFTDNLAVLVISLRAVNIALFAVGIYLYNRLFRQIGISQIFINVGMLVFILLPIVPFIAATINYDNMLFPLTAIFLITTSQIILNKKINVLQILLLIAVGCFASLVKSTFLPIFALSVVYLVVVLLKRHGKKTVRRLAESIRRTSRPKLVALTLAALVTIGLFSNLFLQNIVRYGSIQPACTEVLSVERCAVDAGAIRNKNAVETKETRPLIQLPEYISDWITQMANWTSMTGSRTASTGTVIRQPLPVIYVVVFLGGIVAVGCLLYAWRAIQRNSAWRYLIVISGGLILAVFIQNYMTYLKLHAAYAVQPRYLLTIIPIIIVFSVVATAYIMKRYARAKTIVFLATLLVMSQGGGLTTHVLLSNSDWYWDNSIVRDVNQNTRELLRPLIKENDGRDD